MNFEYQLLDSGNLQKLEQVGVYRLIRPALNAFWKPSLSKKEWEEVAGSFQRNNTGDGQWKWNKQVPNSWIIECGKLKFIVKPTDFGHLGFFAEQKNNWDWLRNVIKNNPNLQTLNLFAYSGGSSLAMAETGAKVCHTDAAKGMIDWAKENLNLNSHIQRNIRWIIDDVNKFISKEIRRGTIYQGIVLDPPSFGRGSKGQVWKIENDLIPLLEKCRLLMGNNPKFILLSLHSHGYTPISLERILESIFPKNGTISSEEMLIKEQTGRYLPAGICAKWINKEK